MPVVTPPVATPPVSTQTVSTPAVESPQTDAAPVIRVSTVTDSAPAPLPATSAPAPVVQVQQVFHQPQVVPAPSRTVTQSPDQLRKAIVVACGRMVREVRVDKGSDRLTVVHVVADPVTEQQLIGKLLALPEITATNVRLEIHVSH